MASSPSASPPSVRRVGVVGAGTMGAGIAQVAAQAGFHVRLHDIQQPFIERGLASIRASLERLVARQKLTEAEAKDVLERVHTTTELRELGDCEVVIEAAPEDMGLKREIFRSLHQYCPETAVLASNTSSLSITELGAASGRPDRVVGMHFFNPPVLMDLVEVVRGYGSSEESVTLVRDLARRFGKVPVLVQDTPGFIVNRVARPFYLESLRILGEGVADVPTIDACIRGVGFRIGPFQLMDLIGLDVNFAVTRSVFEQMFYEPRFRPHPIQQALVRAGHWGRKTGRGFYDYSVDPPAVAYFGPAWTEISDAFWQRWQQPSLAAGHVVGRVLAALINEAHFALGDGVASEADIDTAMRLGMAWPRGPFAWGQELGLALVRDTLDHLYAQYREERFRAAPLLRARA